MFLLYLIPLLLLHASAPVSAQQVGSFFTAIYINGVPASSSQSSCANMGQPNYCCITGQSCAWDDAGKVACCPAGSNCQGYAYGAGAGAAGQYQYYSSPTTYNQQPRTTTVYQGNGAVVPIVPVTVATVLTPVAPAPAPASTFTYYTTPAAVAAVVTTNVGACQGGYTTLTMANVGAPVRTVGCQVIFNGARKGRGEVGGKGFMMRVLGLVGMALWVA